MNRSSLAAHVAWRLVRSKKSHGAVGTISLVALCGMAIATAALVCVLSVFNGFKEVIAGRLDTLAPDIAISPTQGKTLSNPDSIIDIVSADRDVELAIPTLTDNALAIADNRELPVLLKGVPLNDYRHVTGISTVLVDGSTYPLAEQDQGIASIGVASRLSAFPPAEMLLFAPRRHGRVNLANPSSSFITDSISISAISRTDQSDYDESLVIVDIATARRLFERDGGASTIEVKVRQGTDASSTAARLASLLGPMVTVKDRLQQQQTNFRMIMIEKWVTYLLLFFILIIASFNVISSLSMLVIDKTPSADALRALGMSRHDVGLTFAMQSIYITMAGGIIGILLGLCLSLLQQHFGMITINTGTPDPMPYPVSVLPSDLLLTLLPVSLIALVTALITSRFALRRLSH